MALMKRCLVLTIVIVLTMIYMSGLIIYDPDINETAYVYTETYVLPNHLLHVKKNWRQFEEDKMKKKLSKLGKIMYLNEEKPPIIPRQNPYKILVWQYGPSIERRHIYHFGKTKHDPFEDCSVKNCLLSYDSEDISFADLVIIHLHRTKGVSDLPPKESRTNPKQIWAFLSDESPFHTFLNSKNKLNEYNGYFNWSMTYNIDSDIPVPYGRVLLRNTTLEMSTLTQQFNEWLRTKRSDVLVAVMNSNCKTINRRWEYVKELEKHMKVDTYGSCGKLKCPGHFNDDCTKLNNYKFYLSFENSNCDDYITEKLYWNAYEKDAIPIIMGASKKNLLTHLPEESFISVEDFASPRDLASYLIYLNKTPSELIRFYAWRMHFTVLQEHGYFQSSSRHYCRVCEALNYNDKKYNVYDDLENFLSTKKCYPAWDSPS